MKSLVKTIIINRYLFFSDFFPLLFLLIASVDDGSKFRDERGKILGKEETTKGS